MLTAKEIRAYRQSKDLTLKEVSKYSGIVQPTLSELENEKITLTEQLYKRFIDGINKAFFARFNEEAKAKQIDD